MTAYTAETLTAMKTVELRKLAKEFGVQKLDRDGVEVSVNTGRKDELIANILRQQEFNATYVSAEGRKNANLHPVYGWPIAGEQKGEKAERTKNGTVKGKLCAECGEKPVDKKTQGRDSTMCTGCFEQAEIQNEHYDGGHDETPMSNCDLCADVPPAKEISPKALRFEADAKAAGWNALARNAADGSGVSIVTATAPDGRMLELNWAGRACVDGENYLVRADGKRVKIRNASAARKILAES